MGITYSAGGGQCLAHLNYRFREMWPWSPADWNFIVHSDNDLVHETFC